MTRAADAARPPRISIDMWIWLLAFALRCLFLIEARHTPAFGLLMGDGRSYDRWAQQLAAGDWLGHEVFYQAPLYPYLLGACYAVFGRHLLVVRLLQAALGATACLWLGRAGRWFVSPRAGRLAALLLAIYPSAIFFDVTMQKTVLDVSVLTLLLASMAWAGEHPSRGRCAIVGVILGVLSVTRENAIILAPIIAGWLWRRANDGTSSRRGVRAAVFACGLAAVLLPVGLRNAVVGGEFHLVTAQLGPNFYIGNNPAADGSYQPLQRSRGDAVYEREDATRMAESALRRPLRPSEVSRYWTARALTYVRSQPARWLKLFVRKWLLVWNRLELADTEDQDTYAESSRILSGFGPLLHFGVIVPLAAFGLAATWRTCPRLRVLAIIVLVYSTSLAMFFLLARYRLPLVPVLLLFGAAGLIAAWDAWPQRQWRPLAAPAGCALAAALVANLPMWPPRTRDRLRAATHYNTGITLATQGKLSDAIQEMRRSVLLDPAEPDVYAQLAITLGKTGQTEEAVQQEWRALALRPQDPTLHYDLGNLLAKQGRADEAISQYTDALRLDPQHIEARNNLAIILAEQGRTREAIAQFFAILSAHPDHSAAWINLSKALAQDGKIADAAAALTQALARRPDDAAIHDELGVLLMTHQQVAAGLEELTEALRIGPETPQLHNNMGAALTLLGQLDEAVSHFERALALQPDFAQARANREAVLRRRRMRAQPLAHPNTDTAAAASGETRP